MAQFGRGRILLLYSECGEGLPEILAELIARRFSCVYIAPRYSPAGRFAGEHTTRRDRRCRCLTGVAELLDELVPPAREKTILTHSMLTLFAAPKNFRGHISTIQRNAISSWTRLTPRPEILLFGDEEGAAEIARELGLRHFPGVARNELGTPLLGDLFHQAEQHASNPLLGYVNADIILTDEFCAALDRVRSRYEKFMMVGRRWDIEWGQPLDFSQAGWAESIRAAAVQANVQRPGNFIDYFVFSRGVCDGLLPLAIGRPTFDNYLLWRARSSGAELVDVSPVVVAIHQNHDYSHRLLVSGDLREEPEYKSNRKLVGGWWHLYTIEDATQILTADGLRPSRRHAWLMAKRLWSHPLTILQLPWLAVKRLVRA